MPATAEPAAERSGVLIAIGSNRYHRAYGPPAGVVAGAVARLGEAGVAVEAVSRIRTTPPLGPPQRCYANAVVRGSTTLAPRALLAALQGVERAFGRRTRRRWDARVLDLDIIAMGALVLPSPLRWRAAAADLVVPHRRMHERLFVLDPLAEVAPRWRHPRLRLTTLQLLARLRRRSRAPVEARTPGLAAPGVLT